MQTDTPTRLLLAGILVCLIVLIVQGYGSSGQARAGRYQMMAMRAGTPLLIRMDTATGRVWKQELRGGRGRWVELSEPEEDASETAMAAPEPPVEAPAPQAAAREPRTAALRLPAREPAAGAAPATRTFGASPEADLESFVKAVRSVQVPVDIRVWAVIQLGGIDDSRSTEVLLEALQDEETRVVAAAVTAVASRDDDGIAEALEAVRANLDPAVQAALGALDNAP